MDQRRYELATLAAARRLRSSYCMLAHGSATLAKDLAEPDELRAIATDHRKRRARLRRGRGDGPRRQGRRRRDEHHCSRTSTRCGEAGLTDPEILDVVLAAAARCFMSKVIDAVGALPDHAYEERLDPALREALTVGRPIAAS